MANVHVAALLCIPVHVHVDMIINYVMVLLKF